MAGIASPIGAAAAAAAPASIFTTTSKSSATGGSGQIDFTKLLMAQMQHQDPTSPTNPTDFVTQMAQFSSVQGITQLNQSIASLLALQGLTQGVGLIGKTVAYTSASGQKASGTVSAVAMVSGQPQLVINNVNVSMSQIQSIQAGPKKSAAA
jgi:flagellar basal-body rod modification protein FlgD